MGTIPVIIPFYKEHEKLARCREHLQAQSYPDIEVFVRDNTHDNIYFTAAVNEGLKKYCFNPQIEYVAILNQDAYLAPDAIARLAAFLDTHPDAGIACPIQLTDSREVTWAGSLQAFPFGAHRGGALDSFSEPFETPWANGAALLVRTEMVREIGLMDKNLRFICSDADFSFTARARGWKSYVVPAALCEHSLSGSAKSGNLELSLIKVNDALYFARKWLSGDLYKSIAYEGPTLTRTSVRLEVENLERVQQQLEAKMRLAR